MINNTSFIRETDDNYQIFTQKWIAVEEPKAVIIIVHGLGEHSSRYQHLAHYFNTQQYSVYSFDQRGHGKSSGPRGDIPSYNIACNDVDSIIKSVREDYPLIPIFLYGHSLGGAIVLYYGLTRSSPINGIICTSPGLASGVPLPPLKMGLAKVLASIAPKTAINNGLDVENLSHDHKVIDDYKNDPLVHPMISARLGMELISKGPWMIENANQFKYPLLLLQGEMDHLVDPKMTLKFAKALGSAKVQFREFPGLFHEMHNELNNSEFLSTIIEWLEKRLAN